MSAPDVPLFDVQFTAAERDAAIGPLDDGWLTMGPRTERFERAFADVIGADHVVAVGSGTAALHLALQVLNVGPGDEVICPSLTFVATANAIRYVGATPVFCEIAGAHDLNLDPDDVERRVTTRTRAIIAVHYAGHAADLARLEAICERHGLHLVEDAAHACVTTLGGRACGTWGACGCFSFYSNKNITCGEGGAVATADARLARRLRLLRSHAMTTSTAERHAGRADGYEVNETGYNFRLDELRASLALAQLARLEEFERGRTEAVSRYRALLADVPVTVPAFAPHAPGGPGDRLVPHIFPVLLPPGTDRSAVRARMRAAGVQTSVHYPPVHRLAAFAAPDGAASLPVTEAVAARELTLPLFPTITPAQQERVRDTLASALAAP